MAELKRIEKTAERQAVSPASIEKLTSENSVDTAPDGTGAGLGKGPDLSGMAKSGGSIDSAPVYNSQYGSEINALAKKILNRDEFSYNPEEDENYLQYEKKYTKAGKRAMEDTIGDVSANTGGLASSYATTAGQQAYNNYMGALADKVPELRQLAYEMYQDDYQRDLNTLGILQSLESGDYAKYRDSMGDYYTDRNFNYQLDRDKVLDARYDDQWNYQKATDQRDYLQSEYQFDANRTDRNNQFQMSYDMQNKSLAMALWEALGTADETVANTLGVKVGTPTTSHQYQLWQQEMTERKNGYT